MNMRFLVIIVAVAIAAAAMAPVIANDQRSRRTENCSVMKKFDKKSKSCVWKY